MKAKEELLDLYEIIVSVDTQREYARMEKYRVKKTGKNYLPQRIAGDLEGKGYSHRMSSRLPLDGLMKVNRQLFGGFDHVYMSIYCLEGQKREALERVITEVDSAVLSMLRNAQAVNKIWVNRKDVVHERTPGKPAPKELLESLV